MYYQSSLQLALQHFFLVRKRRSASARRWMNTFRSTSRRLRHRHLRLQSRTPRRHLRQEYPQRHPWLSDLREYWQNGQVGRIDCSRGVKGVGDGSEGSHQDSGRGSRLPVKIVDRRADAEQRDSIHDRLLGVVGR